jgi:hypothetical protein
MRRPWAVSATLRAAGADSAAAVAGDACRPGAPADSVGEAAPGVGAGLIAVRVCAAADRPGVGSITAGGWAT